LDFYNPSNSPDVDARVLPQFVDFLIQHTRLLEANSSNFWLVRLI
jgi:hypothetical protein